ncbi:MAG: hypothetical protein CVU07_09100 [Bacteroidetes bacterium HGW-Bacteroidetes-23]|nr:MAG: hypothetical protein CVU07_09100 [Bacteroidetes bacterium HGW-Bacteroidetes-23]
MKRVFKNPNSKIILENFRYRSNTNNSNLGNLLLIEQRNFCAYTEHYIGSDDASDIEHFNPNLKDKPEDNYFNWYKVKHLPNQRKTKNWIENILMPYDESLENRVLYFDGEYHARPNDEAANNLIILLDLNNPKRIEDRKRYIKRRKEALEDKQLKTKEEIRAYFQQKIDSGIETIRYLRAIQEEFQIDIWNMIPQPQ